MGPVRFLDLVKTFCVLISKISSSKLCVTIYLCVFSSPTDNQDELFDLIMAGKFEFPSPFWDHISDAAKVRNSNNIKTLLKDTIQTKQTLRRTYVAILSLILFLISSIP